MKYSIVERRPSDKYGNVVHVDRYTNRSESYLAQTTVGITWLLMPAPPASRVTGHSTEQELEGEVLESVLAPAWSLSLPLPQSNAIGGDNGKVQNRGVRTRSCGATRAAAAFFTAAALAVRVATPKNLMDNNDVWAELRDMQAHERVSLGCLL